MLGGPAAAFLGVLLGALVNAPFVARSARAASASASATVLFDLVHFACGGLLVASAVALWRLIVRRRWWLDLLAAFGASAALGLPLLAYDLGNFSQRHAGVLPAALIRALVTLGVAAAIPGALLVASQLRRFRIGRGAALLAAVAAFTGNGMVLARDYDGVHLYAAWAAATLAGAALVGLEIGRWPRLHAVVPARSKWLSVATLLVVTVAAVSALLASHPRARVASALARTSGSVLAPLASRVRARFGGGKFASPVPSDAWLQGRAKAQPVAASKPRLVPENAVVVLITVDALRADVVNSRRYDARIPNLAKLRDTSVSFTQARSTSSVTRLSIASIYMGTHFLQQFWTKHDDHFTFMPIEEPSVRFTELLGSAGVSTATMTSMRWLRSKFGVVRGFQHEKHVTSLPGQLFAPSELVFDKVLPFLKSAGPGPAFFFAHLSDTHSPYDLGGKGGPAFERYLDEATYFDQSLGRLLALLDEPELRQRSVLILSADHGDAFGEHGSTNHGTTLYDEVVRVPLLVRGPGLRAREVDALVSLIDLGPTVLDLYGVATPGHFMGQSLVPFLRGGSAKLTRPVVSETRSLISYVNPDSMKVVYDTKTHHVELYDLRRDPAELENLSDDEALLAQPLGYVRKFHEVHRLRRAGYERPDVR